MKRVSWEEVKCQAFKKDPEFEREYKAGLVELEREIAEIKANLDKPTRQKRAFGTESGKFSDARYL